MVVPKVFNLLSKISSFFITICERYRLPTVWSEIYTVLFLILGKNWRIVIWEWIVHAIYEEEKNNDLKKAAAFTLLVEKSKSFFHENAKKDSDLIFINLG